MMGAKNEAIALKNWPRVRLLANKWPLTTLDNNGFNDTCIMALPIPSKAKEINIME